ncbi:Protein of unknown function (DUF1691) [Geosmithia morbida]|uniref:Mitochondrial adapter protein MCP1 transmembrane domain-containing protein n=1 Tax=Geosmithia morbida TaxID=1094350 RepID=A0A9P4YPP7_9HYPO|nr:Protein of unknown function (DUF1691) [Geosmithia morbida]KAF4119458.1 Protein of unknown function (DUF1691) [Geosmithia morbida]
MEDNEFQPTDRRQGRDSQATTSSLAFVDPAPIEMIEVDDEEKQSTQDTERLDSSHTSHEDDPAPHTGSTVTLGLSGLGRGAVYYLTRIQKYSSYAMSIFTSLHLCNVSLIPAATGSIDASETYFLMTREIYQTSISEPALVLLPFVAHLGSGIALRLLRRSQAIKRYGRAVATRQRVAGTRSATSSPWPPLNYISVSGYGLMAFYTAHVAMNRILPLMIEGDSSNIGLAYVAHGFARHPAVSRLAYVGLIVTAAGHMVWGTAKWLGLAPSTRASLSPSLAGLSAPLATKDVRRQRRRWLGVHAVTLGVMVLWSVGGLGIVAPSGASDGWVGTLYDNLFSKMCL